MLNPSSGHFVYVNSNRDNMAGLIINIHLCTDDLSNGEDYWYVTSEETSFSKVTLEKVSSLTRQMRNLL